MSSCKVEITEGTLEMYTPFGFQYSYGNRVQDLDPAIVLASQSPCFNLDNMAFFLQHPDVMSLVFGAPIQQLQGDTYELI